MADSTTGPLSTEMAFSVEQRHVLATLERVGGALSLVGVFLIFITFYWSKRIRTIPNHFILFASIANIGASVASIIALDGIEQGEGSGLCQTQAFLFEMFMQADPWWSAAMAINVYMVFFRGHNPASFRRQLWVYNALCFGVPAVPAFICLLVRPNGRPMYGDSILWCWINHEWSSLRIYTYYLPIWLCIALSAVIYFAVGYQVFHQRNQLRNLTLSNQGKDCSASDVRDSAEKNLTSNASYWGTVTTEVQVTTSSKDPCCDGNAGDPESPPPTPPGSGPTPADPRYHPWGSAHMHPLFDEERGEPSSPAAELSACSSSIKPMSPYLPNFPFPPTEQRRESDGEGSSIPATRPLPMSSSPPLPPPPNFHSTSVISSGCGVRRKKEDEPASAAALRRFWAPGRHIRARLRHLDPVKLAYLRTSFVFAISVLVTWTPSSINRVYNLIYPDKVSYPLNLASAAVLPLQGVWNAVIYFSTSWKTLRQEWEDLCRRTPWLRRLVASSVACSTAGKRKGSSSGGGEVGGPALAIPGSSSAGCPPRSLLDGPGHFDRYDLGGPGGGGVPLSPLGRVASRQQSHVDADLSPRSSSRTNNVRVQRGGDLDISF
ncbi:G-protein coupled receptor [Magnaporthiopsis poae ATCC 64411]|uniref:G-protein coupled receptor n=1 Tax=Magnaporthiopsis poae (strain ATCC 64411 / 73-15) TaxID=644358 RepID=A0A0C4EBU6_MAGP6|nr:G-protein coupled receptor [Magnaporthiopsis poae ATCC 64411]